MDLARVRREIAQAKESFYYVETQPTSDGQLSVLSAMQTALNRTYTLAVQFPEAYPNVMPHVYVRKPALRADAPHRYKAGNICYLHATFWNPGQHNLTLVLARAAKWLNKYDVWLGTGEWPGAEILH